MCLVGCAWPGRSPARSPPHPTARSTCADNDGHDGNLLRQIAGRHFHLAFPFHFPPGRCVGGGHTLTARPGQRRQRLMANTKAATHSHLGPGSGGDSSVSDIYRNITHFVAPHFVRSIFHIFICSHTHTPREREGTPPPASTPPVHRWDIAYAGAIVDFVRLGADVLNFTVKSNDSVTFRNATSAYSSARHPSGSAPYIELPNDQRSKGCLRVTQEHSFGAANYLGQGNANCDRHYQKFVRLA